MRHRIASLFLALALLTALTMAGCGGGGADKAPEGGCRSCLADK